MSVERWDGTRFVPQRITRRDGAQDVDVNVSRHNASTGGPSAPTAAPGLPRSLTVQVVGTTATLRWEPPVSNGGGPITQYRVSRSGGFSTLLSADGYLSGLSYAFTGLTSGAAYTLSVTALNAAFESAASSVGVTIGGQTDPGDRRPIGSIPYGIYIHAAAGQTKLQVIADWIGRQNDLGLDFQASDTADNLAYPSWQHTRWRTVQLCLGTTLTPGIGSNRNWAAVGTGSQDSIHQLLGQRLVANNQARARLRGNHEFNGDWFQHRVQPGEQQAFIAAWRRWVTTLRATPGQAFGFDWNPTHGDTLWLQDPTTAWPGRDFVSAVALDVYDDYYTRGWLPGGTGSQAPPTQGEREAVLDHIMNGRRGLNFWAQFARDQGLPFCLPEWGTRSWKERDGLIHGGGDNVLFVEEMHKFITDARNNVLYHAPWEDPGQGFHNGQVPNATARYVELFHGPRVAAYVGMP